MAKRPRLVIDDIDEDLRRRFKIRCINIGTSMSRALKELIKLELEKGILEKSKKGKS